MLDGIENRSLILRVSVVNQGAQINQQLSRTDVTLSDRVIYASLPIFVLFVNIFMHLIDNEVDDLIVAISRCIKERRLF